MNPLESTDSRKAWVQGLVVYQRPLIVPLQKLATKTNLSKGRIFANIGGSKNNNDVTLAITYTIFNKIFFIGLAYVMSSLWFDPSMSVTNQPSLYTRPCWLLEREQLCRHQKYAKTTATKDNLEEQLMIFIFRARLPCHAVCH